MVRNTLIIALVLAVAAGGYYWYQDKDTRYARQVMDCMYAGSFEPIKDTLNAETQKAMDDTRMKALSPQAPAKLKQYYDQAGARLKQHYGEIRKMEFKSGGPVEGPYAKLFSADTTQKIWTATSDKGTFDVTLYMDKDGKLLTVIPGPLTPLKASE